MSTETALAFEQETLFQMVVQAAMESAIENLPDDVQQGDASMVVTELAITFPVIEMHDCVIFEMLQDFSLTSQLEERRQMIHELGATVFVDLNRDRVRPGRFLTRKLLHGPDGFVGRRREVEVNIGLHLRQTGDGDPAGRGGTVDDASEVLDPLLKNWCLLSEEGTAVGAEKRRYCFGWRTVDSFGCGVEVVSFVAVRVPLDLFGFQSRPCVRHLPQPLLHKAATGVENCFAFVGVAFDEGLMQAVLLGEQVADGDIAVIESVPVLATCATEDGEGRRLDCVLQLTPSALHGGVLVSGGGSLGGNSGWKAIFAELQNVKLGRAEFFRSVYAFWKLKREVRRGVPLLKRLQASSINRGVASLAAAAAAGDEEAQKMRSQLLFWQRLRQDLERSRLLSELTRKRERVKRDLFRLTQQQFELRLRPLMALLKKTLEKLQAKDSRRIFAEPVSRDIAPDYYSVIEEPMDFSTMRKKLEDHEYLSVADMEKDFNQIVDNCCSYNAPDTVYYRTALQLMSYASEVFTKAKEQEKVGLFDISPEPDLSSLPTDIPPAVTGDLETARSCGHSPLPPCPIPNAADVAEPLNKETATSLHKSRQSARPVAIPLPPPTELKSPVPSEMRSRLRSRCSDQVSPTTVSTIDASGSQGREAPPKRRRIAATASHGSPCRLRRSTVPGPLRLTPTSVHGFTTPVSDASEVIPSRGLLTTDIASPTDAANLLAKGAGTTTATVPPTASRMESRHGGLRLPRSPDLCRPAFTTYRSRPAAKDYDEEEEEEEDDDDDDDDDDDGEDEERRNGTEKASDSDTQETLAAVDQKKDNLQASEDLPDSAWLPERHLRNRVTGGPQPSSPLTPQKSATTVAGTSRFSTVRLNRHEAQPAKQRRMLTSKLRQSKGRSPGSQSRPMQHQQLRRRRGQLRGRSANILCRSNPRLLRRGGGIGNLSAGQCRTQSVSANASLDLTTPAPPTIRIRAAETDFGGEVEAKGIGAASRSEEGEPRSPEPLVATSDDLPLLALTDRDSDEETEEAADSKFELTESPSVCSPPPSVRSSLGLRPRIYNLEPLDLVWAKCRGSPWYPALLIDPSAPAENYNHNGVPIPTPPESVLTSASRLAGSISPSWSGKGSISSVSPLPRSSHPNLLVLFFDAKRTWQWLPREKLQPLAVDNEIDQEKLQEARRSKLRNSVVKAYERALEHYRKVHGRPYLQSQLSESVGNSASSRAFVF
nr:unnamed protein product [Spirometra erinaceieuropaei]